jgi:hypothetical protein
MNESADKPFNWQRYGDAYELIVHNLEKMMDLHPGLAALSKKITLHAGARLFDVADHLVLPANEWRHKLEETGFTNRGDLYFMENSNLPPVMVDPKSGSHAGVAVRVESIVNFLMQNQLSCSIDGGPFSPFRRCHLSTGPKVSLWLVERRKQMVFEPEELPDTLVSRCLSVLELWKSRKRNGGDEYNAMNHNIQLARIQVEEVGAALATDLFFEAERNYWQSRNKAASLQKMLLDKGGIGWSNHDHHTYRSSRRHFIKLLEFFTILGFKRRERFYAGVEAGWGAQVMEHPETGIVLFLDTDLGPSELDIDFSQNPLPEQEDLGTVGLWCGLHGESLLEAGLHHLAIKSDFWQLRENLRKQGVRMMAPFSNFPYLKQAFTMGERWQVNHRRLHALRITSRINVAEAVFFSDNGAIGSHLENIQRTRGYKGFSRQEVSNIIRDTDPRRQ